MTDFGSCDPDFEIEFRTGSTAHSINLVMKYKIFTTSIEKLEKNVNLFLKGQENTRKKTESKNNATIDSTKYH